MEVIKTTNNIGEQNLYDIRLTDEEQKGKSLNILYGGNGDLYWLLRSNNENETSYENFSITKEDYDIYKLFDDLYYDIVNTQVFKPSIASIDEEDELTEEDIEELETQRIKEIEICQKINSSLKDEQSYKKLVHDGTITWYSDDSNKENSEIMKITKLEDEYLLEFIKQNTKDDKIWNFPGSINIRISNSGSTYAPFNMVFMRHFSNFQQFERKTYHQVHIEEYLYHKKIKQKKKDK